MAAKFTLDSLARMIAGEDVEQVINHLQHDATFANKIVVFGGLETPLICLAVMTGRIEIVCLLLAAGANISAKDGNGQTPADWAKEWNNERVLQEAVQLSASSLDIFKNYNAEQTRELERYLNFRCPGNFTQKIAAEAFELIRNGANPNVKGNRSSWNILNYLAFNGFVDEFNTALKLGCRLDKSGIEACESPAMADLKDSMKCRSERVLVPTT